MQRIPVLSAALSTGSSVTDVLRNTVFGDSQRQCTGTDNKVSAVRTDFTVLTALTTSVSVFPVIALKPHIPN